MPSPVVGRRRVVQAACLLPMLTGCSLPRPGGGGVPSTWTRVAAPFAMPPVRAPDFTRARRLTITDFGAVPGDRARTAAAIDRAIAAAHAAGSGVVVVPPGVWPARRIHLRSNVALLVDKGATLSFSDDPADYLPPVRTSWEGIECLNYSPLIYAFDCENVAVLGEGTLRAELAGWRPWYARPKPHMDALVALYDMARTGVPVSARDMTVGAANLRPHFLQFNRCRNVLVEDVSIDGSPFWTIHPLLCRDVTVRRVRIRAHGHNNDGVDPEMSENVLIEHCTFDQGDDAISVKSGRDMDAWRLATPCRNVVVRHCRIVNGHQLLAVGSELSGGIENILVEDCHFTGDGRGADGWAVPINNLLYVKTNERRGGYVRNIHMVNVTATAIKGAVVAVETDVLYQWKTLTPTYVRRLTAISGIHVRDIRVGRAKAIALVKGERDAPVRDVRVERVRVAEIDGPPVVTENVVAFDRMD